MGVQSSDCPRALERRSGLKYDAALLERVAQKFRSDMWESVVPEAITESGIQIARFGPVQATAFGDLPEFRLLHQIQGAAEPGAVEDGHLAAAVEWMRAREVDYRVPVPNSRPGAASAEAWLGQRGYECGGGWVKFVRDASPPQLPSVPGIVVHELGKDEIEGEGLSAIAAEALDMPVTAATLFFSLPQLEGWRCYTAALGPGELPVATGTLLIHEGVAQLGLGTTLELARGRGCGTALLKRRLEDASAAGCQTMFVEVGGGDPESVASVCRSLTRAGFEEAYEGRIWQRPALHPAQVH
jgi:GNAT superfamily N-acetyltransferase